MLAYARNEINRTRTTLSKTKPSSEQPRESARGSQPSRTPVTRGGAGERNAPHPFRRKPTLSSEQLRESARGSQPSRTPVTRGGAGERNAPHPFRRKPTLSSEQLRESARGSQPSRLPSPEGVQGSRAPHARFVGNNAHKRTACFVGNQNLHQNSPVRAREGRNPLDSRPPRGV